MKSWKAQIRGLREFIDNPSPTNRYSAQWSLESIEEVLTKIEEEECRELEELKRWADEAEAEFLSQHEAHAHVNGICD